MNLVIIRVTTVAGASSGNQPMPMVRDRETFIYLTAD
jgi:hypothetical protein